MPVQCVCLRQCYVPVVTQYSVMWQALYDSTWHCGHALPCHVTVAQYYTVVKGVGSMCAGRYTTPKEVSEPGWIYVPVNTGSTVTVCKTRSKRSSLPRNGYLSLRSTCTHSEYRMVHTYSPKLSSSYALGPPTVSAPLERVGLRRQRRSLRVSPRD